MEDLDSPKLTAFMPISEGGVPLHQHGKYESALNIATSSQNIITEVDHADNLKRPLIFGEETTPPSNVKGDVPGLYASNLNIETSSKDIITEVDLADNSKGHAFFGEKTAPQHASTLNMASSSLHKGIEAVNADDLHQDSEVSYTINRNIDSSLEFVDLSSNLILKLIPDNSCFHSQLKVFDRNENLLFKFQGKIFTMSNTWKAFGPDDKRFKVSNKLRLKDDSDLLVKVNGGSEKSGFDLTIKGSKTDRSFFVYKGYKRVSKVVAEWNRYLVSIESEYDCDILKEILISVTAIVDAKGRSDAEGVCTAACVIKTLVAVGVALFEVLSGDCCA